MAEPALTQFDGDARFRLLALVTGTGLDEPGPATPVPDHPVVFGPAAADIDESRRPGPSA